MHFYTSGGSVMSLSHQMAWISDDVPLSKTEHPFGEKILCLLIKVLHMQMAAFAFSFYRRRSLVVWNESYRTHVGSWRLISTMWASKLLTMVLRMVALSAAWPYLCTVVTTLDLFFPFSVMQFSVIGVLHYEISCLTFEMHHSAVQILKAIVWILVIHTGQQFGPRRTQGSPPEFNNRYNERLLRDMATQANVSLSRPGSTLGVCVMSADFWGSPTAGGTATAYHLLAHVRSETCDR